MKHFSFTLVFFSLLILTGCVPALTRPDFSLQEVELTGVSFSSMDLTFLVKVKNPNPVGVTIEKLTYQLDLGDASLGAGETSSPISLKGAGSEEVPLPFSVSLGGMTHLLRSILGEQEISYRLTGKVVLSKFWFKKEFPFEDKGIVPINRSTFHH